MPTSAELRAQLAVVELEERLVAVKADPKATNEDKRALKAQVRAARQEFREAFPPETRGEPGSTAAPEPVTAGLTAQKGA